MNKKKWMLLVVPVMALLLNLACGFSATTANIKAAQLAKDEAGTQQTTTFAPSDTTFYCNVDLANAPDDTTIKAVWTAVEVQGTDPNQVIDQSELKAGSGTVNFKLSNNGAWPVGKYKVDLYLEDKLSKTIEFQVQ